MTEPDTWDPQDMAERLALRDRIGAALERLRALEDELKEIQLDIESGP